MGSVGANLQRRQRQPQVVDRARRAGQVIDDVDRLVDREMIRDVVIHEDEIVAAQVLDVLKRPGLQVVEANDSVSVAGKRIAEMRSKKARASCDDGGRHLADATQASGTLLHPSQRIYAP